MIRSVTTSSGVARTRRARAARDEHWPRRCEAASRRLGRSVQRVAPNQSNTPTPAFLPSPPVFRRATRRRPREAGTGQKAKPYLAAAEREGWVGVEIGVAREAGVSSSRPPPPPASSSRARLGSARGRRAIPLSPTNQSALRRSAARPRPPLDRLSGGLGWSGDPLPERTLLDWIGLDWI